jgi:hypothetical protein
VNCRRLNPKSEEASVTKLLQLSELNMPVFGDVTVNIFRSFGGTLPSETSLAAIQLTRLNFPVGLHLQQHRCENLILRINLRTVLLLLPNLPFCQIGDLRYFCLGAFLLLLQLKLLFMTLNLMNISRVFHEARPLSRRPLTHGRHVIFYSKPPC